MKLKELKAKSLAELRKMAASVGVPGRSRLKKAALVEALLASGDGGEEEPRQSSLRGGSSSPTGRGAPQPPARRPDQLPARRPDVALAHAASTEVETRKDGTVDVLREVPTGTAALKHAATVVEEEARRRPPATAGGAPPMGAEAGFAAHPREERQPVHEHHSEPSEDQIYIDRGAILPESYPGTRVRVMVRDPGTLYVYWEVSSGPPGEGWEIIAFDAGGDAITSFRVGKEGNNGYLYLDVDEVERVTLQPIGVAEMPAATVDLASTLPETVSSGGPAPWVEIPPIFSGNSKVRAPWPTTREETGTRWAVGRRRVSGPEGAEPAPTRKDSAPWQAPFSGELAGPPPGPDGHREMPSSHNMPSSHDLHRTSKRRR